ncbi:MAG: arylesterase [Burkholderiaceae bacterium]
MLGDSLSAEYGIERGKGWVSLVEQRLRARGLAVEFINASISGSITDDGRARIAHLLEKHRPAVVIIELGANDALRGLPLENTRGNLDAMIEASRKIDARVLLVGMQVPPNYGHYGEQFAGLFPTIAARHSIELVPFLLAPLVGRRDLFQADGIHPTAQAQPLLADTVEPHLLPLIEQAAESR